LVFIAFLLEALKG